MPYSTKLNWVETSSLASRHRFRKKTLPMDNTRMFEMELSGKVAEAHLVVEMDPLFNSTLGAFFMAGTVAAAKVAAEETYNAVRQGSVSLNFEGSLKKMCKEGAYWGTVAGVYGGMEYGMEKIHGIRDWKNVMIAGALTGALASAANGNNGDQIVMDTIVGGAVATAAHFLQRRWHENETRKSNFNETNKYLNIL